MPFVFIHVGFHVFTTLEVGCRLWMLCQPVLLYVSPQTLTNIEACFVENASLSMICRSEITASV